MAQPHNPIADALDRLVPDFDALVRDARLGRPGYQLHLHELEDRAQRIASALVAPFRGAGSKPVHAPLEVRHGPGGRCRAGW